MVKSFVFWIFSALFVATPTLAKTEATPVASIEISADNIRIGCKILIENHNQEDFEDPLSNPPHSISINWSCPAENLLTIDTYDIEGSSPTVASILIRKSGLLIALVKWTILSNASDSQGDFYRGFAYKFNRIDKIHPFSIQKNLTHILGSGWDGIENGRPVTYELKDIGLLQEKLDRLGY